MVPSTTGATTEVWRHGSRASGFERCSSTFTPSNVGERVGERPGVVRERAGVDHDRGAAAAGAVDRVDQRRPRGSTAGARRVRPCVGRRLGRRRRRGRRGGGAVDLGLALAEQVQVRPGAAGRWRIASCSLASAHRVASAMSSGDAGRRRSTPLGPSSTNVSPPTRLLVAAHQRDAARRDRARRADRRGRS